MADLGTVLAATEAERFVGRRAILETFRRIVTEAAREPRVVTLVGPAGAGKSALLRHLLRAEPTRRSVWLSGERIAPNADAFTAALRSESGGTLEELGRGRKADIIVIDAFERLRALERWLFDEALPKAGARICVFLTSRERPERQSRSAWGSAMREFDLPPFTDGEAREYLRRRGVPTASHEAIVRYAAGHALALGIIADRYELDRDHQFTPGAAPDVVATLVSEFTRDAPSAEHERALFALSIPWTLDEELLGAMLNRPAPEVRTIFRWLSTLTFVERRGGNLIPHALARNVLYDDLVQGAPERHRQLVDNASALILDRICALGPLAAPIEVMRALYMRRRAAPFLDPFHFDELSQCSYRPVTAASLPTLTGVVARWEGEDSGERFRAAFAHAPELAFAVHAATSEPLALNAFVTMHDAPAALREGDPLLERAHAIWRELEPEGKWDLAFARWRMTASGYQALGVEMQAVLTGGPFLTSLRAPNVRWVLFAASPPAAWEPLAPPFGLEIVGRIAWGERSYTLALADTHRIAGGPFGPQEMTKRLTRVHLRNLAALGERDEVSAGVDGSPPNAALDALRAAVIRIDGVRAGNRRRDPRRVWKALHEGEWSLVDRFERDGRRYYVALPNEPPTLPSILTDREARVVSRCGLGHSNKLIAYELGISESSVARALSRASEKLGVASRVELVRRASELLAPSSE